LCKFCWAKGIISQIIEFVYDVKFYENPHNWTISEKSSIPSTLRHEVWKKYISAYYRTGKCFCCKTTTIEESNFECGHIISKKGNGPNTLRNLRPICSQCNKSMSACNMHEFIKECGFWTDNIIAIHDFLNKEQELVISMFFEKKTQVLDSSVLPPKNEVFLEPEKNLSGIALPIKIYKDSLVLEGMEKKLHDFVLENNLKNIENY
jgi:hypothetical protein